MKGVKLPDDFILSYSFWIKLSHFDKIEHNFLRSQGKCNYERVKEILENHDSKKSLVIQLQKCKLFVIKRCKAVVDANKVIKTDLKQGLEKTLNQLKCQKFF